MRRHRKSKFRSDKLPVEAFSDIAFLLIIFFILVTSLTKHKGFLTEIPAGQKSEEKLDKIPSVNIKDNIVLFEGNAVSMDELRAKLLELKLGEKQDQEKMVTLEATGQASYQNYFASMAAIDAAGGIVTIVKEDTSGGDGK
ncbi:MAG: biopolymer transporter ExbD [Planctomycetota bacterium]|nr:biopolymer transporter ExbD [Planctomycetota bacterium]MDA1139006.1 biopolymer transporter ExbD [Planctomycetota bacterium]